MDARRHRLVVALIHLLAAGRGRLGHPGAEACDVAADPDGAELDGPDASPELTFGLVSYWKVDDGAGSTRVIDGSGSCRPRLYYPGGSSIRSPAT